MPRKTSNKAHESEKNLSRFNEAAARCRGKPSEAGGPEPQQRASMRPRPDAAENVPPHPPFDRLTDASMRPRPDAAENPGMSVCTFAMLRPLQ